MHIAVAAQLLFEYYQNTFCMPAPKYITFKAQSVEIAKVLGMDR